MLVVWSGLMVVLVALAGLTAVGAHRRGAGLPLATLAGLVFPMTWTVWYLCDQHPYGRARP